MAAAVLAELAHYDKDYRKEAQEALCRGLRAMGSGGTTYSAVEIKSFLAAVVKQVRVDRTFLLLSLPRVYVFLHVYLTRTSRDHHLSCVCSHFPTFRAARRRDIRREVACCQLRAAASRRGACGRYCAMRGKDEHFAAEQ